MRNQDIPGRVFLDTSVVNFTLDHGEQIHDNARHPASCVPGLRCRDIQRVPGQALSGQPGRELGLFERVSAGRFIVMRTVDR